MKPWPVKDKDSVKVSWLTTASPRLLNSRKSVFFELSKSNRKWENRRSKPRRNGRPTLRRQKKNTKWLESSKRPKRDTWISKLLQKSSTSLWMSQMRHLISKSRWKTVNSKTMIVMTRRNFSTSLLGESGWRYSRKERKLVNRISSSRRTKLQLVKGPSSSWTPWLNC